MERSEFLGTSLAPGAARPVRLNGNENPLGISPAARRASLAR